MIRRSTWRRAFATVVLILIGLSPADGDRAAAADVSGDTYTSPLYGYTLTWDQTWFVVEEVSADYDSLTLTNGLTYATFLAGPDSSTTLESALGGVVGLMRSDPAAGDVTPLVDAGGNVVRGEDADHAFAAFTFTLAFPDGMQMEMVGYLEARLLMPIGSALLGVLAYVPAERFDTERPRIEQLIDGLRLPGPGADPAAGPEIDPSSEPSIPDDVTPMPAFVADRWRVAVVTSALNADVVEVGLERRPDKEWLVVVLDVTNWSDITNLTMTAVPLSLRDFSLSVDGVAKPFRTAPSSTRAIAAGVGAATPSDELEVLLAPDETARVALVFLLPERSRLLELRHGDAVFPLADTLSADLDPDSLPSPLPAPVVEGGTIVSASDGRTMRVQLDGETESRRIHLLGVTPPQEGACLEHGAEVLLDELAGSTVLLESEPTIDDDQSTERYVWLIGDDGRRILLNHLLVAEGQAMAEDAPNDVIFGSWLSAAERAARARKVGLWAPCTSA